MVGNYNKDKTKKRQTTSNRSLASCDQLFWLLRNWLEMANTCCCY